MTQSSLLGGAAGITNELDDDGVLPLLLVVDGRGFLEAKLVLGEVDVVDELFDCILPAFADAFMLTPTDIGEMLNRLLSCLPLD